MTPDPVGLAILTKRFAGIVGKMQNTLLRTARSGVINMGRDFSCCILTHDAQLLAVGESLPIHVMVGSDMMVRSMVAFHPELARGTPSCTTRPTTAARTPPICRCWCR